VFFPGGRAAAKPEKENPVLRRITAIGCALAFVPLAVALADEPGAGEVIMIQKERAKPVPAPQPVVEQPVTAPPPPFVELESTAIAAGIGARFGEGTLLVAGQEHPFTVKGLTVGDLGISRISASGGVENLGDVSDFEGHYVAVEAGAAAGVGASALTMRNEKGVVLTLNSDVKGVQLTLGAQGLNVELR
jgi:hypothetical protein